MKTLYIFSQYRVGERIFPTIPKMRKKSLLDCLFLYQMSSDYSWPGDYDVRDDFLQEYSNYFRDMTSDKTKLNYSEYDLIICDDNRDTPKTKLREIYNQKTGIMIGCYHGAGEKWNNKTFFQNGYKTVWDKTFVMGNSDSLESYCLPIGIPSNDCLNKYTLEQNHILIIVNFLGNRYSPFKVNFDKILFDNLDLIGLQKKYNLPIILKLKSREDERKTQENNLDYIHKVMPKVDYKIIVDTEDNDKLITQSKLVLSAPSTLAYKSIQLGIPTILIKDSGQLGNFSFYKGLVKNNKQLIANKITELEEKPYDEKFIEKNIAGGINFDSTNMMIKQIERLLNDK